MNKMTILGIGNSGNYNYLVIKKGKGFLEWLDILLNQGIDGFYADVEYYLSERKNYEKIKKKIADLKDNHESYTSANGKIHVDVFYGEKRVFLSLILPLKKRKKLMNKLEEISIWAKNKK